MSYTSLEARDTPVLSLLANKFLRRATLGIEYGQLVITTPAGQTHCFGRQGLGPLAYLNIHDWNLVRRLLANWDVGFAESYMAGEWSSPDLAALLDLMCRNERMCAASRALGLLRSFLRVRHLLKRNTRRGSRRNIAAHYDLGNEFYQQWLDAGLAYSSAIYSTRGQTLEEAQRTKLDRIVDLLDIPAGGKVLEIGCGWGGLAERILQRTGCRLTGLTLSAEQLAFARQRLQRLGCQNTWDLRLQDYRDVADTYDRIVSIEMLEAVGEAYWPIYFAKLCESLNPQGFAVLQVITIAEENFAAYRKYPDFIQRYIFPGGMLPTVRIMQRQIETHGMKLVSSEFFADSYTRTLADWRSRFQNAWPSIEALGFDPSFRRRWEYYLAYCQAGFEAGLLNVGLYKITRAS